MSSPESRLHTQRSLLLRLRDPRDATAWQLFVDTYAPLIYRFCQQRGLQEADIADVAQEVLAQVMRSIGTFDYAPERGRFRGWLGAVVRGKICRFRSKNERGPAGVEGLDETAAAAEDPAWTAEFNAHIVRVALERIRTEFEPTTWQAFELTWSENQAPTAAARAVGLSVAAVYVAKSRVLKRLREEVLVLAEDIPHLVPLH